MELQGKIKVINETQSVGTSNFLKREVVITTEEQYPQIIAIEFVQDKTKLLDKFRAGENVTIGINIRGREWVNPQGETKYFNSIQGWKIDKVGSSSNMPPVPQPIPDNEEDVLPF